VGKSACGGSERGSRPSSTRGGEGGGRVGGSRGGSNQRARRGGPHGPVVATARPVGSLSVRIGAAHVEVRATSSSRSSWSCSAVASSSKAERIDATQLEMGHAARAVESGVHAGVRMWRGLHPVSLAGQRPSVDAQQRVAVVNHENVRPVVFRLRHPSRPLLLFAAPSRTSRTRVVRASGVIGF
jgi:hypothetical protein